MILRLGANAIAQIAAIEIPRNEWLDIINTLARNTMEGNFEIKRASIITLGFISQELKQIEAKIDPSACEQILGSLILGIREEALAEASLNALRDSIAFIHHILSNQQFCSSML